MPRKREQEVFTFKELSPKAKERALERYRDHMWDQGETDDLSDQFKSILSERGFKNPDVGWSLGYNQGDGVCFWGDIDLPKFFEWARRGDDPKYSKAMKSKVGPFLPLGPFVSVSVLSDDRRYCHWNSMDVAMELRGEGVQLVPKSLRDEALDHIDRLQNAAREYDRKLFQVHEERMAPVREWRRRAEDREKLIRKGPKEWRPLPRIGPKPEPLNIPDPIPEVIEAPPRIQAAFDKATLEWKRLEDLMPSFEEFMKQWVEDTSRELEKMGYDEIKYRTSDAAIEEFFEGNEFEFLEDGTVVR